MGILDSYVAASPYCPLRYSQGLGSSWVTTIVSPSTNGASHWGLAYHPVTCGPYVAYQNGGDQYLAHFDGTSWASEIVVATGAAGGSSLAFDPATGEAMIAYGGSGSVRFAWHDAGGWHIETIDSGFGAFHAPSLHIDPASGNPCVAYAHTFYGSYFARRVGPGNWEISLVESLSFPYDTVLRFNPVTGHPGMAYVISMGAPVKYAEFNGSNWDMWQASAPGHTCWTPVGLAYLADGTPVVAYAAGPFSSVPVSRTSFHIARMEDNEFSILSEHSYGQYNWNGPVDLFIDGGSVHVAYQAVNIGTHLATAMLDNQGPITSEMVAVPNPAPISEDILLTANVDDATTGGSNIVSAEYSLDGGVIWQPMSAEDGAFDEVSEDVAATIPAFLAPGVHAVMVRGSDAAGIRSDPVSIFVVVYDAEGGFVTGGGWIYSLPGAYPANASLEGKATFGFVAKYKKGASVPAGETEFRFRVADLDFSSTSYDWLVVAGAKAQFKGTGTINGAGNYGFMLTATDGSIQGSGGADKFRIKIWDKSTDRVVYDNQIGSSDGTDPTTVIGGGSIVIHKM